MVKAFDGHTCSVCDTHVTLFKEIPIFTAARNPRAGEALPDGKLETCPKETALPTYPPQPLDSAREASII